MGRPSPFGLIAGPRSSTSAFLAISTLGGNRSYASGHPFDGVADAPENLIDLPDAFDLRHQHAGAAVVAEDWGRASVVLVAALQSRVAGFVSPTPDLLP